MNDAVATSATGMGTPRLVRGDAFLPGDNAKSRALLGTLLRYAEIVGA